MFAPTCFTTISSQLALRQPDKNLHNYKLMALPQKTSLVRSFDALVLYQFFSHLTKAIMKPPQKLEATRVSQGSWFGRRWSFWGSEN
jgi:hypothetical protein